MQHKRHPMDVKAYHIRAQTLTSRAICLATTNYLHLTGEGTTPDVNYSWCGSEAQFSRLPIEHDEFIPVGRNAT